MSKSKPGYYNHKPLMKTIRRLRKVLGEQDSCFQTIEASIRLLEVTAQSKQISLKDFVRGKCEEYGISYGSHNFSTVNRKIHESYIVQTYNIVEPFFKELNFEYQKWRGLDRGLWKNKDGDKNLDPFNQFCLNTPVGSCNKIKAYPEAKLLDYYRLIRNSVVHAQLNSNQFEKPENYYHDSIVPLRAHFIENYDGYAPSSPGNIEFKDFMLYTRSLKYFSNILNDYCFPEISDLVTFCCSDPVLKKSMKSTLYPSTTGNIIKCIKKLSGYFSFNFGHGFKDLRDSFCRQYLASEGIKVLD